MNISTDSVSTRTKILAIIPNIMPSTIILVVDPLMWLLSSGRIELRVRLEKLDARSSDLVWADLIVFCRNTEPAYDFAERTLEIEKPYIYELDDNLFELSPTAQGAKYHLAPERVAQLEKYITHASLVHVYSRPLETRIRQITSNVKLLKAPVNLDGIFPASPPKRDLHKIKILFTTSRTASDNLSQIFIKDLIRILVEYGGQVEAHFWGYMPEQLREFPSVKFHRFISNYKEYMQAIYAGGYDIGLAPVKDDLFHNSKTNNKFREYGACWIAGIYSNAEVYSHCVEDGKTGLLISNEEGAWYSALNRLINDLPLRQRIQESARTFVEKEYSLNTYALSFLNDINHVLSMRGTQAPPRKAGEKNLAVAKSPQRWSKVFWGIIKMLVHSVQDIFRSIIDYGVATTLRLILEKIEKYVRYFELRCEIKRKQN
jgi:glycosyltransferase involved in cell wall biosynthesis